MIIDPNLGKLCHKHNGSSLCYKHGGSQLIFKANPNPGIITVIIQADQSQVGPIKSCGNIHQVIITPTATFTTGTGTATVKSSTAGNVILEIEITNASNGATIQVSCTTLSKGCAYPDENPGMNFNITATQTGGVDPVSTNKSVTNVADEAHGGLFSFTVSVGTDKKLSGVN